MSFISLGTLVFGSSTGDLVGGRFFGYGDARASRCLLRNRLRSGCFDTAALVPHGVYLGTDWGRFFDTTTLVLLGAYSGTDGGWFFDMAALVPRVI